jgi:RecB family exonuclease
VVEDRILDAPPALERRTALRRRAMELLGALEAAPPDGATERERLIGELVEVARDAAGVADEARLAGLDPLTLRVVSRHTPAGQALLELAPLPPTFSHSSLDSYRGCPLRFAFEKVYRIPTGREPAPFVFGHAVHAAFERFVRATQEARAAGEPLPGLDRLEQEFAAEWRPEGLGDAATAADYRDRATSLLRRFHARELAVAGDAIALEQPFAFDLEPDDGSPVVRFTGVIDRIDRHPDGSLEVIDYKTGRARPQRDVDQDLQLTAYAYALRSGAVADPTTGEPLPAAARLTLHFTEADQRLTTTRSDAQLDAFAQEVLALARRIRGGDFAARPEQWRCRWCDFQRLCPSRWGDP